MVSWMAVMGLLFSLIRQGAREQPDFDTLGSVSGRLDLHVILVVHLPRLLHILALTLRLLSRTLPL